jgi:hypothetical protein
MYLDVTNLPFVAEKDLDVAKVAEIAEGREGKGGLELDGGHVAARVEAYRLMPNVDSSDFFIHGLLVVQCDQTFCEKMRPILLKYRPKWSLSK